MIFLYGWFQTSKAQNAIPNRRILIIFFMWGTCQLADVKVCNLEKGSLQLHLALHALAVAPLSRSLCCDQSYMQALLYCFRFLAAQLWLLLCLLADWQGFSSYGFVHLLKGTCILPYVAVYLCSLFQGNNIFLDFYFFFLFLDLEVWA